MSSRGLANLVVRRYDPEDRESCRHLWRELTETHRGLYKDPEIGGEAPEDYFDEHLSKVGQRNIWLAVSEGVIAGMIGIMVSDEEAEVEPLIVREGYRGKGIGTRLVQVAFEEAKRLKVRYLNVRPVARNSEAIRFFAEKGFTHVGRVELFVDYTNKEWKEGLDLHGTKLTF